MLTYTVKWRTETGLRVRHVFTNYIAAQTQHNVILNAGRAATLYMEDMNRVPKSALPRAQVIWQQERAP